MTVGLTFEELKQANASRVQRWHPGFPADDGWSGADWSNAMQGEAGEAGNVVKKLRRIETGHITAEQEDADTLRQKLALELGDTVVYLDLLAQYYGIDLATCVGLTFNSHREGYPERL